MMEQWVITTQQELGVREVKVKLVTEQSMSDYG
jgi:hypothetical protein